MSEPAFDGYQTFGFDEKYLYDALAISRRDSYED